MLLTFLLMIVKIFCMTFIQLKNHFKTQAAVARALGISEGAVSRMRKQGIPEGRQFKLQHITNGALKVDEKFYAPKSKP